MKMWTDIRRKVLVEGVSKRQVKAEYRIHARTLEKILANPQPPGYRMNRPRPKPVIGPFLGRIEEILQRDKQIPKKQRHTSKRIFERLKEEGCAGGYTQVKDAVRNLHIRLRDVYIALSHRPGEAQMDFGYALAKVDGTLRKIAFFVMSLPYSDAVYVHAYGKICTEVFWDGHVRAWTLEAPEAGEYVVEIDYSLQKSHAGLPVDVLVDGKKQFSFVTEETGGYDKYKKSAVGTVKLAAGKQDFAFDLNKSDVSKLYVTQLRGVYLTKK